MASASPFPAGGAADLPYELGYDRAAGLITLRPIRQVVDSDAGRLCRDFDPLLVQMRADWGDIRMLFDMRDTPLFAGLVFTKVIETVDRRKMSGDRFAVLVNGSMVKAEAKQSLDQQCQAFLSLSAAMTWLNAWVGIAQPGIDQIAAK